MWIAVAELAIQRFLQLVVTRTVSVFHVRCLQAGARKHPLEFPPKLCDDNAQSPNLPQPALRNGSKLSFNRDLSLEHIPTRAPLTQTTAPHIQPMSAVTNRLKPAKPQGDNFRQRLSQLKGSVQNCGRHSAWWKAPSPKHCYA